MRQFYYPTKDASIYQAFPERNTGLDEILNIGKDNTTVELGLYSNRILIAFDVAAISASILSGSTSLAASYYLNLNLASAQYLKENQQLLCYPVSQSWNGGTGYFYQDVKNPQDGASWIYSLGTGSFWASSGSSYIASPSSSFTFSTVTDISDVRMDVTPIVKGWLSGTFPNNGLLIKLPDTDESSSVVKSTLAFFSNQTHTIYRPSLEAAWNNQTFVTGTLTPAPNESKVVLLKNLFEAYKVGVNSRIRIIAREAYPQKVHDNVFRYSNTSYLPQTSYYSVVDISANKDVIPFDDYSLISCDSTGSYFVLDTTPLYPNRFYKILIKVVGTEGTEIFENTQYFKITQ